MSTEENIFITFINNFIMSNDTLILCLDLKFLFLLFNLGHEVVLFSSENNFTLLMYKIFFMIFYIF